MDLSGGRGWPPDDDWRQALQHASWLARSYHEARPGVNGRTISGNFRRCRRRTIPYGERSARSRPRGRLPRRRAAAERRDGDDLRRRAALHERAALKVMSAAIVDDAVQRRRFEQEARVSARIASDHVVRVIASGVDDDLPWLAMELLEGETLADRLKR